MRSSRTCSRGSPPYTSTRRRAAPADISSVSCSWSLISSFRLGDRLVSWTARQRQRRVRALAGGPGRSPSGHAADAAAGTGPGARSSPAAVGSAAERAMTAAASAKWRRSTSVTTSGSPRRSASRTGTWWSASARRSAPGATIVMYVREYGSSVRQTRWRVAFPDSSTIRPWKAASATASAWMSPLSAASRISRMSSSSSSRSASARRGMARRAASDSSWARTAKASRSSSADGRRTRAPRKAVVSTTPSASRSRRASRTGRLARPELPGDPGLDDPGARRVAAVEDGLEEAILDLVAQDAARDRGVARHDRAVSPSCRRPRSSRGSRRRRCCRPPGAGRRS